MSSMGGRMSFAGFSAYSGTKFALEGFSEALAAEVGTLGVKVLVVEPGAFPHDPVRRHECLCGARRQRGRGRPGDPAKAAAAVIPALGADVTPLRLPLGDGAVEAVVGHLDGVRAEIGAWEQVARDTAFNG